MALLRVFDEYIRKTGIDAPEEPPRGPGLPPPISSSGIRELDLRGAGIVVVWASGFHCDFRWIDLPIFDEQREPTHRRGITAIPGLSFLGLQWLYKRKSSLRPGARPGRRAWDARSPATATSVWAALPPRWP